MVCVNLGHFASGNLLPAMAYGVLRSSDVVTDALCLAIQGAAFGILLGNPLLGAAMGATMAVTDRLFAPIINHMPGRCETMKGLPMGLKNIALLAASTAAASVCMWKMGHLR